MRKIVKFENVAGRTPKVGKAFQEMLDFIENRRVIEMVVIAETHTFPGRTDKLVLRFPKGPKIRRVKVRRRKT